MFLKTLEPTPVLTLLPTFIPGWTEVAVPKWEKFPTFTKKHECNECFFNWLKQRKNNVTTLVLVEIHRYVEQSGI